MASACVQHTVFGFDSRIDWKPTVFVDGLPKNRVCSACGLVSAAIALLPCNHLLCSRCYDGSGDGERLVCPLDKDIGKPEDVIWSTFSRDNLLGRNIQCWNSSSGCDVQGAGFEVMDHFEDCQYHEVSCSRCKRSMPYKELLGHLETGDCFMPEANAASMNHSIPEATITPFVEAVGELRDQLSSLQTCLHETKDLFMGQVQVFIERAATDTLVAESVQTLDNTLKESIRQSEVAAGRTAEELALIRSSSSVVTDSLSEVVGLVKEMKILLTGSLSEQMREISAACRNLQERQDVLSASSQREFEISRKYLEARQKKLHSSLRDKQDVKECLK
ncbi:uncharacterized protein LOC144157878 [Haemaphysalis longicornis]